jgi:hypothetical protein
VVKLNGWPVRREYVLIDLADGGAYSKDIEDIYLYSREVAIKFDEWRKLLIGSCPSENETDASSARWAERLFRFRMQLDEAIFHYD